VERRWARRSKEGRGYSDRRDLTSGTREENGGAFMYRYADTEYEKMQGGGICEVISILELTIYHGL
jgi:hypothetical protein